MKIDIASDFSPKPFGRDEEDKTKFHGKRFREEFLAPNFKKNPTEDIEVYLDGVERGYGSSFFEEAFAGLIRQGVSYSDVKNRLKIITKNKDYFDEIWEYIEDERENEGVND
ncbi:STAS-like domain-containing protein [Pseudoalteromonas sp. CnMc7-15]|uniref:STAS-like domain-containing protein n=1 Tax=unclassified Pseudoalteromonas TaxID=194690 RepID=UPI001EF47C78|nr:STAS-like domain-containing protein [Pseudoalteromonas sp. CnMc7-15]MCG7565080.1 STAS-like domain-containing protein [Pseudoalteromonas sp. CnMc7-15]